MAHAVCRDNAQPPRKDDSIWNLGGEVWKPSAGSTQLPPTLKCVSQEGSWPLCGTARAGDAGFGGSEPTVCLCPCSELWGCHLLLGFFPRTVCCCVISCVVIEVGCNAQGGAETPTSSSSFPGMSQVFWRQGHSSAAVAHQDGICWCFLHFIFLSAPFATPP